MTRQEANLLILSALEKYFKDHPDMRFNQALSNLGVTMDKLIVYEHGYSEVESIDYYEEPKETLAKIKLCQE